MIDTVPVAPDRRAPIGSYCIPALFPELALLAHKLIHTSHVRRTVSVKERVERAHELLFTCSFGVPGCGRSRRVTQPHTFRMNASVGPSGNEGAHQIGVLSRRCVFDGVEHLTHISGTMEDR